MKIFVSYRSSNSDKVDSIVIRLRSLNDERHVPYHTIWQDKDSIPPGQDWWEAITDAIIDCDVFLFMVSQDSVLSINCCVELSYARKRNRPIIPLVLEGEFTYNPVTGKNDISYWEHMPVEIRDSRAQLLFYEGVSFVSRLDAAFDQIRREPQGWRDIPASKPPDPRIITDENVDSTALYNEACDYAFRLEFNTAERLFQRLVNANDSDFGEEAHEWILILRGYDRIRRLDIHETTRYKVQTLWNTYLQQFPKTFISLFDPGDFRARFANESIVSNQIIPSASMLSGVSNILPMPFGWISIDGGAVTLTEGGFITGPVRTFETPAFSIGKYPVTNAQFAQFVIENGYSYDEWWTEEGWAAREQHGWNEPRYWRDNRWNQPEYPVVGISWYEAVAFCHWLSKKTGEQITLPTEQQWQYAAQGNAKSAFPWGNMFDPTRCNFGNDSGLTPVSKYEGKGNSGFGVVDMSGNVWEWCLTAYDSGSSELPGASVRTLRGGSWNDTDQDALRVDFRNWNFPDGWNTNWGFRLARL